MLLLVGLRLHHPLHVVLDDHIALGLGDAAGTPGPPFAGDDEAVEGPGEEDAADGGPEVDLLGEGADVADCADGGG